MDEELPSSELGTKDYWDQTYEREIENFQENGDVGEVWFGEDSVERIVDWMEESDLISKDSSILDLGCGNGVFLIELAKLEYTDLTGVDYSQNAIDLADAVAKEANAQIDYETCDIVADLPTSGPSCLRKQYCVLHDKGTYDAISLNPENSMTNRERYRSNLQKLLKENGLFVITSCNWTDEELKSFFKNEFEVHEKIPTPSFQFGGKTGNTQTVLVFKKTS